MNQRPSLANIVPIEHVKHSAAPRPQQLMSRNRSVPNLTDDDHKPNGKRESPEEPARPTSPAPPVRGVPQGPPKVIQRISKQRIPPRFQSKSAIEQSTSSELHTEGTRRNTTAVISRSDLNAVQAAIKNSEANAANRQASTTSKADVRRLHSRLRNSYKGKSTFEMTFQARRRDDSKKSQDFANTQETMKSVDSGIFSTPEDDESAGDQWRVKWLQDKAGSAVGEIRGVKGICFVDDEKVAIAEEKNARIQIFDKRRGKSFTVVEDPFPVRRMKLGGVCQLPYRRFLAATDRQGVVYFEPTVEGVTEWKTFEKQIHLHGIAVNSREHLILTDLQKKRVYSYDISGKRILKFKPDDFIRPDYVAVSEEYSMVFVSDSEQGCVYMLSMDGKLLNKIGRQGTEQERLIYPLGVCCQQNGKLIVADRVQHRISTYDFRAQCYEHLFTRDDLLYNPTCIATDGDKYLAVAEENHDFKVDEYKLKMLYKCGR